MAHINDWPSLAAIDPRWTQFVDDHLGGVKPDAGLAPDVPSLRQALQQAKEAAVASGQVLPDIPGVREQDHRVTMRDGTEITCRVHSPETPPAGGGPLWVWFHGGGWCVGNLETEANLCRLLVSKLGVTCVNVDYRLAPEHRFPTAAYDCYDATKWAAANASSLGANPSKGFLLGGTSAGGNLTAVVNLLARDEKLSPPITGALLSIPAVVAPSALPEKYRADYISYEQNKAAPILSRAAMDLFLDNYIPDVAAHGNQLMSPLLWESGHKDLPPTAFLICGADPLRDEGLIYERLLREGGVKTKAEVYPGLPHGFWTVAPHLDSSKKYFVDVISMAKWLLEQ